MVGHHWPWWDTIDHGGPPLTMVGHHWPWWATFDHGGPPLTMVVKKQQSRLLEVMVNNNMTKLLLIIEQELFLENMMKTGLWKRQENKRTRWNLTKVLPAACCSSNPGAALFPNRDTTAVWPTITGYLLLPPSNSLRQFSGQTSLISVFFSLHFHACLSDNALYL